jgi:hypothetical protein
MRVVLAVLAMGFALMEVSGSTEALQAAQARAANATNGTAEKGSVSTGPATELTPFANVPSGCTTPGVTVQPDVFPIMIGVVQSEDGKRWTVPAPVHDGPVAVDLYNNCTGPGDNPNYLSQLKTFVVDPDGVEITGYIHADNYFELYVNGKYVARDSIPMTPFNTSVVRFKAKYPMTYAIMGVDWETHQGVGMEYAAWNIGDAGFIAYFSDGNGTHNDWRAETFYIAPLDNPNCVRTAGGRDSSFCTQSVRPTCAVKDPKTCKALHWPIPDAWTSARFDDSRWPRAIIWSAEEVTNQRAYTDYTKYFGDAEFVWTRNLHLDDLVLARYTAKGPRKK